MSEAWERYCREQGYRDSRDFWKQQARISNAPPLQPHAQPKRRPPLLRAIRTAGAEKRQERLALQLLDFLNTPEALAAVAAISAADRAMVHRLLQTYRYALGEYVPVPQNRARTRDRRAAVATLDRLLAISDDKDVEGFSTPAEKLLRVKAVAAATRQSHDALFAGLLVRAPQRGRRLVRKVKRNRADVDARVRDLARTTLLELERAARATTEIHQATLGTRPDRSPTGRVQPQDAPSEGGIALVRALEQAWAALLIKRVRRCAWPYCDIPGGRYFLAATSQRDCAVCAQTVSRDTRSRVRRGITKSPRKRR